jgi:hypothetical protein
MLLRPGKGGDELKLGKLMPEIRRVLGPPPSVKKGPDFRIYWVYRNLGIDCMFSVRSERLLSLFLFAEGADGHTKAAQVTTDRGVLLGDKRSKVLRVYGRPDLKDESFVTADGDYVREWYSYHSGIGFHFGKDARVEMISIFAPRRTQAA